MAKMTVLISAFDWQIKWVLKGSEFTDDCATESQGVPISHMAVSKCMNRFISS